MVHGGTDRRRASSGEIVLLLLRVVVRGWGGELTCGEASLDPVTEVTVLARLTARSPAVVAEGA